MESLDSWKEFYEHVVSEENRSGLYKKVYRKLFNYIKLQGGTVYIKSDNQLNVLRKTNGYTFSSVIYTHNLIDKIPKEFKFDKVEFPLGLTRAFSELKNIKALEFKDGSYQKVFIHNNPFDIVNYSNIVDTHNSEHNLRNKVLDDNQDKLHEFRYLNRSYYLVLKDVYTFKKGVVISTYRGYDVSDYKCNRKPVELYEEKYHTFFSLECDLNNDIEPPQKMSCIKRDFGCQRGCMTACLSETSYKMHLGAYKLLLDLKEKI